MVPFAIFVAEIAAPDFMFAFAMFVRLLPAPSTLNVLFVRVSVESFNTTVPVAAGNVIVLSALGLSAVSITS